MQGAPQWVSRTEIKIHSTRCRPRSTVDRRYLDLGRIAGDADIDTLAPTLIGAAHLLFADRTSSPPTPDAVHGMVTTVIAHVASEKGNRR